MKVATAENRQFLQISKGEWLRIGQKNGWIRQGAVREDVVSVVNNLEQILRWCDRWEDRQPPPLISSEWEKAKINAREIATRIIESMKASDVMADMELRGLETAVKLLSLGDRKTVERLRQKAEKLQDKYTTYLEDW